MLSTRNVFFVSLLATLAVARTDLAGCTSSISGNSYVYYVPDTGEICSILDCGGGRAPPKTTVPGCPGYGGTATYSPEYLTLPATATTTSAAEATSTESAQAAPTTTEITSATAMSTSELSPTDQTTQIATATETLAGSTTPTSAPTRLATSSSSAQSSSAGASSAASSSPAPTGNAANVMRGGDAVGLVASLAVAVGLGWALV